MNNIELFYNKFNEDKRLKTRHGRVEYEVTSDFIDKYLKDGDVIYDIGCGCGAYAIPLLMRGFDVNCVDMVQYNLGIVAKKYRKITDSGEYAQMGELTTKKRNAMKLNKIGDNVSDLTLLLGPMYHLLTLEDRRAALSEAIRITKPGGHIFVGYMMNDYAILMHGFFERTILSDIEKGRVDDEYRVVSKPDDIYSYVTLDDIDRIISDCPVRREAIFSPDGAANHLRSVLNALSPEEFERFIEYQKKNALREDLLGAGGHTVDVLSVLK